MIRKTRITLAVAAAAAIGTAGVAAASVTFDPATGTGFSGKGDVQYTLGLNNAQLQKLDPTFTYNSTSTEVTEVAWECTNERNEKIQERARTTTTTSSITGVVDAVARVKNQITGFNLLGYTSSVISSSSTSDGPGIDTCPNANGTWFLSTPAGAPTVVSSESTGGLFVNGVPLISPPVIVAPVV